MLAPGNTSKGFEEVQSIASPLAHCLCVRGESKVGVESDPQDLGVRHNARSDPSQVICESLRDWRVSEVKRVLGTHLWIQLGPCCDIGRMV